MRRTAVLVLAGMLFLAPCAVFSAEKQGLTVTPLRDDFGGGNAQGVLPPGPQSGVFSGGGASSPPPPDAEEGGGQSAAAGAARSSATDGMVMSYLVDLARKQNKPCPSGKTPPVPPSLIFSEPLCRAAETMGGGKDFPAALAEQGLFAERWRMFSAAGSSAQKVAASLRQTHCEALLEPYTHIGATRGADGWRVVMAVLTDRKPAAAVLNDAPEDVPARASQN